MPLSKRMIILASFVTSCLLCRVTHEKALSGLFDDEVDKVKEVKDFTIGRMYMQINQQQLQLS